MIFYLDTSNSFLWGAIYQDGKIIDSINQNLNYNLSTLALSEIKELFSRNNLSPFDLKKIIVVNGPGSFTGIRIGVTIAKVMAYSLNVPIITISSLEAMAISHNGYTVPIINARRGYVYGGIYNNGENLLNDQYIAFDKLFEHLKDIKEYQFISNDSFDNVKVINYQPDFLKIIEKYQNKTSIPVHLVDANYLKRSEAEERLEDER